MEINTFTFQPEHKLGTVFPVVGAIVDPVWALFIETLCSADTLDKASCVSPD